MSAISGPYVSGTLITSSSINARLADIENEVTGSLSRTGKGEMQAPIRGVDGSVATPSISFTAEHGLGDYRKGAGNICRAVGGADVLCTSAAGAAVTGTLAATGAVSGTTGTFSAAVSGTTGTFSGAVSGTTGTFSAGTFSAPSSMTGSASHAPVLLTPQAAPASPSNGEVWVETGTDALKYQANGTTRTAGLGISLSAACNTGNTNTGLASGVRLSLGITCTGASSGGTCAVGTDTAFPNFIVVKDCIVTANTCTVELMNTDSGSSHSSGTGTIYCRTFN